MNDYEIYMLVVGSGDDPHIFTVNGLCACDGGRTVESIEEVLAASGDHLKPMKYQATCNDGHIVHIIDQPIMVYYRRKDGN